MNPRHEHLKNLMRHSSYAELHITNQLFDENHTINGNTERHQEIKNAIEYLEKNKVEITITPGEEYTILKLTPK